MLEIDEPLYSSRKDEPLTSTDSTLYLTSEPLDMTVIRPELKTIPEPIKQVDFGNGVYALKPSIPITTDNNKPLYIDIEKLIRRVEPLEAEKLIRNIENKTIDDTTLQELIIDGTISESQPTKEKKKTGFINSVTNYIYNLIFN